METNDSAALIGQYFPELTEHQLAQFEQLGELFREWNEKINLISRKDIDHLYERHVLHSLGIAQVLIFRDDMRVLDVGTGGGFPGIPLAIMYPHTQFLLVDSIGKKIAVVKDIAERLGLTNVVAEHKRAEDVKGRFDFVVSRAVARVSKLLPWVRNKMHATPKHPTYDNGLLLLKGGDLTEELKEIKQPTEVFPLSKYYVEPFFETKQVVYVEM